MVEVRIVKSKTPSPREGHNSFSKVLFENLWDMGQWNRGGGNTVSPPSLYFRPIFPIVAESWRTSRNFREQHFESWVSKILWRGFRWWFFGDEGCGWRLHYHRLQPGAYTTTDYMRRGLTSPLRFDNKKKIKKNYKKKKKKWKKKEKKKKKKKEEKRGKKK